MVTRGAQVTDDNYGPIEDYLLRNYGKVNVNKAGKDDLVLIGGSPGGSGEHREVARRQRADG